jgi:hypothetical protein
LNRQEFDLSSTVTNLHNGLLRTGLLLGLTLAALPSYGESDDGGDWRSRPVAAFLGSTWPVTVYEAESGRLTGTAAVAGASDESDRAVGDLGGEASHRQAVVLTDAGDGVSWAIQAPQAGANAVVVRFSIADAAAGGGASGTVDLSVHNALGKIRTQSVLKLNSRYAWIYGGVMDGTKLFNVPANAVTYGTADSPTHLYDEIQLKLNTPLQAGDIITLTKTAASATAWIAIDFIELETVPAARAQPISFLSITDPQCGAIALDLRRTGSVFDGEDDSSYGSVFNSVLGNNPYNPASFAVIEKDYYSTDTADALKDTVPNAVTGGLSMFELADHNFHSLKTCVDLVSSSDGRYAGVWVPTGRFYARGLLQLPGGITILGAGMWYSKFTAVDTSPPVPVTDKGLTGIAGTSGDLVFSSQAGGADHVTLSNLSIFGNVTQRDVVDAVIPMGIHGEFTHSIFDNIWVEHDFIGINTNLNSSAVKIINSRVRDTFADGIDFYGSTSDSIIRHSTARSTGDDGFAMWSQGSTDDAVSRHNRIVDSVAQLQWYGDGFAIYGGIGGSISRSSASDILNYPCLQMSTQFVPAGLPATASMSAKASDLNLHRCGGNGFKQEFGALLIGTDLENVDGLTIDRINIDSPTYKGIDIRPFSSFPKVTATFSNTWLSNVKIQGAPRCASVHADSGGGAGFDNVCDCATVDSTPAVCSVTNSSPSTFQVDPNTCSATSCRAFAFR